MNRKQRRALASLSTKDVRDFVNKNLARINREYQEQVRKEKLEKQMRKSQAENSLWQLLRKFDIKEAKNHWVYNMWGHGDMKAFSYQHQDPTWTTPEITDQRIIRYGSDSI